MIGSLVLWPAYLTLFIVLLLAGFVLIPLAVLLRLYREDAVAGHYWTLALMTPWDNYEHGISGPRAYKPAAALAWRIVAWSAFRNPVNGLRHLFGVKVDSDRIGYVGNSLDPEAAAMRCPGITYWAFTWQGWLAGFKLARSRGRRMTEVWIGWKLLPKDSLGVKDWRSNAVGFAIQPFLRWDY